MNWYGGGYSSNAEYPIQKTKYSSSYEIVRGGRYWLNSRGVFIYINHDIPLFVDQNSKIADNICFTAKNGPPYIVREIFHFNYKIGFSSNARRTQMNFNHRYFRTKWSIPNDRVIRYPHWGTPYIFKSRIDETLFRGYTDNIAKYGLKASTIMIDSDAQDCMGSNSMDKKRFPNMENLVADIKKKIQGVVFAMQLHPFINESCLPNYEIARKNNYFINFVPPTGMDKLWNPFHKTSVQIDFQNPSATEWLKKELIRFKQETGIDTFSYGSQINYLDTIEDPYENQYLPFDLASTNLMKLEKEFMNPYRLRNGWQDQDLKELSHSHYTFEFIHFKNNWSSKDGLKSMIPFLMQANLHGNPYIIQECFRHKTDEANKELFIRYVQTTAFFPNINYCIGPWEFDQETVDITKKMNKLHEDYTDLILERIKLSFDRGDPINPPIWWIDPEDKDAQMVSDGQVNFHC